MQIVKELTSITFHNFRGYTDATIDFNRFDIFCGPNGSGKTSILNGIQYVLTGQVSNSFDATFADPFDLRRADQSVDEMWVTLRITENTGIHRDIKRRTIFDMAKMKTTQTLDVTPSLGEARGIKENERQLEEHLGKFPPMFDMNTFLRLSDEQRQKLVFRYCPIDGDKYSKGNIERLLLLPFEKVNDERIKLVASNLSKAWEQVGELETDPRTIIAKLQLHFDDTAKKARLEKKSADGAKAATGKIDPSLAKRTLRDLGEIDADIKRIDEEKRELVESLARAKAQDEQRRKNEPERKALEIKIAHGELDDPDKKIESTQEAIKQMVHDLKADTLDKQALDKSLKDIDAKRAKASGLFDHFNKIHETLKVDLNCPICRRAITDEVRKEIASIAYNYGVEVERCDDLKKAATAKINQAELYNDLCNRFKNLQAEKAALADLRMKYNSLRVGSKRDIDASFDVTAAELQLQGYEGRRRTLVDEQFSRQQYDASLLQQKNAALAATKAEANLDVVESILDGISKLRWSILNETIGNFSDEVSKILGLKLFDFKIQTEDEKGKEVFDIGWMGKKGFRSFDSLSQGEQLVTMAGFLSVMISRANPRLPVLLLDGAEILDKFNEQWFIGSMIHSKDILGNIVVTSSRDFDDYLDAVIHDTRKERSEEVFGGWKL